MLFTQILRQSAEQKNGNVDSPNVSSKIKSTPKYVQNVPTKSNVAVNLVVNSLFALGLYCLYKDYTITKQRNESTGTVKIIDQPSNKVSSKEPSEIQNASTFPLVLHSLTYRDLSALTVTMGFLGYITEAARQSFGKKSLVYRISLFSLVLFPTSSYFLYQSRYDKTKGQTTLV
ncbi:Fmp33p [Kluyveromyces lactis]|uniref:KLLA0B07337p n=1 Tax=Kluyveromyces lactis (strain ATCC 8585 / CBS 2359 / DSM 70799 / NBRC 1267 / NRRL Y-1140 / WM37) TaxID=284590 RepID=Q6CW34_KLULA|nr:uncharacterized protein KLLA0_B07337g [Kluyveromyces lactis]CAH02248.1 KLLA0B07337p [Kluyveromyces lactis]|eukprot:XP_451855.1 uncharacterized protein KLLA0_B07337g [Kluyveromyces lactis]